MFYRQIGLARDPVWRMNAFFDLKNLVSLYPLCQNNVVVLAKAEKEG
jgi:hypothetical protein